MQNDCSFGVKGAVVFESRLEQCLFLKLVYRFVVSILK